MEGSNELYTPAEIVLATGISRQTICRRATQLGFERGNGYTAEQVLAMVSMPMQNHRKSLERAEELKDSLNAMFQEHGIPMGIVKAGGKWKVRRAV